MRVARTFSIAICLLTVVVATGCAECFRHDQTVPANLSAKTAVLEQFLDAHPDYQGKAFKSADDYYDINRTLREDFMQPSPPAFYLENWLALVAGFPPRKTLVGLVRDFSDPKNYRDGHYAGPGSGYKCGDKWGLLYVSAGGSGSIIGRGVSGGNPPAFVVDSQAGGERWGWMLPEQRTKFFNAP
jgi:hypothetical protein